MGKKGQVELSFGMIFAIFIIIATIGVAVYVISNFVNLGNCTQISNFYNTLDERVQTAYASDTTNDIFSGNLPSGIQEVCFGNYTQVPLANNDSKNLELQRYLKNGKNVVLYPTKKSCDLERASYTLKHASVENFFCVKTENGRASIKMKFDINKDSKVIIYK